MKKIIFSVLLVLMATTLFATGKKDSSTGGALTGEIRFSWWGTPARDNATIEAIRLYESLHPGVKIIPEPGVFDGYQQKLMAQLAAGNAPDVFTMNPEWLPAVVELGALADLTGKVDVSSHNPEIAKACSVGGKMYGVNASVNANVIVYNKTQADELGIKMPAGAYTWDDLVKICLEAYQKTGGKTYGIPDFRGRNALENFVPNFAFTQLGKEPPFPWTDTQIIITGADVAAVFDYWDKVPAGVLLPADESSLLGSNDDPICTRRTFVEWTWAGTFVGLQNKTQDELVMIEFPNNRKGKGEAVNARPGLVEGVYSRGKNQALAMDFLEWFVTDPEAAKILKGVRGVLPSTIQRQAYLTLPDVSAVDKKIYAITDQIYGKTINPFSPGPPGVVATLFGDGYLRTLGAEVSFKRTTPAQAAARFDAMVKEVMSR